MADERINPEVNNTLADLSGERVQERSNQDFSRHFWSAYKNGHYRFALAGIAIVTPIAAAIGAATAAVLFPGAVLATTLAFAAAGALLGAESFGTIGAAASSRASGLAEKHARLLDAERLGKGTIEATDDKLMYNGRGQHFLFSETPENGKLYSWKSGLTGATVGAAAGGLLGLGGALTLGHGAAAATAVTHAGLLAPAVSGLATGLTHLGVAAGLASGAAGAAVVGAIVLGLFGATFGIERRVLKSFLNQTDANTQGKLHFTDGPDLGRQQSLESDQDLMQHRLRRQEEIARLEKDYNNRISWGALNGRFKGFGGIVPGVVIGAAIGLAVVAGIAVLSTGGLAAIPMAVGGVVAKAAAVTGLFAAMGGALSLKVFSESGTEAGAEATARAIDNEFERNRALRAQGITPPAPKEAKGTWLSPKAGLISGALGAGVGLALTPLIGPAVIHMIPALAGASGGAMAAASTMIGGMTGATYGLGSKTMKAMSTPFTTIYDKVNFGGSPPSPQEKVQLPAPQPTTPAMACKITHEEVTLLNEKLSTGNGKSFTQMAQQLQPSPTVVGV